MKEIKFVDIQELKNNPDNPRIIKDESFKRLKKKLKEFPRGLELNPIIVNDQSIVICGNQRLRALKELGVKKVPTLLADDFTEEELEKFAILDNVSEGEWDWDILSSSYDIEQLEEWGLPIPEDMKIPEEDVDGSEDEIPEEPKDIYVELGDVWKCGRHTVVCGDASNQQWSEASIVITDPPYGIGRDKGFEGFRGFGGVGKPIKGRVYNDEWDAEKPKPEIFKKIAASKKAIVFGGNFFTGDLPQGNHWLVWDKKNTMPTFGDCELAWTNIKRNSVKLYQVEYNGLIGKEKERYHPTQKPVALISALTKDYTKEGETVLDPFLGSGTTLIACERLNRTCYGIELEPKYVQVILQRYYNETGDVPLCENRAVMFKSQE